MKGRCACGRRDDRTKAGQRRCKKCHADDMKLRRQAATNRGTNTLAGTAGIQRKPRESDEAAL